MKLNAAKIKECAAWVEKHGLHPQPCGASVQDFCKALGIDPRTYNRWSKMSEVSAALNAAREKYAARIVFDVENALVKAALGLDAEVTKEKGKAIDEVVREYDPVTGKLIRETKTKKLVTVEAVRERRYYPPDVRAAQFVLTNMAGGTWRQKQDLNVGGQKDERIPIVVSSEETAAKLRDIIDNHAEPDATATEEE